MKPLKRLNKALKEASKKGFIEYNKIEINKVLWKNK